MNTKKPPMVVIAGPTASGKSALARALSRLVPATIVNADASQLYQDLRVLTARPSEPEEAEVPHRLYGVLDGAEACSAAQWAGMAKIEIGMAHAEGRLPVLVGGTGLYLRTLLDGIAPVPAICPGIRETVRAMATGEARARLAACDPEAAARLGPNDRARIARALEVVLSTGQTLAHWQRQMAGGIGDSVRITGVVLLPPRDWLRARCDARFTAMLDEGAREEVAALLARALPPSAPVMRAIGVREIAAMITAPENGADHVAAAQAATRQYAKRQYTWFRHQAPAEWMRIEQQVDTDLINEIAIKLRHIILTR